MTIHYTRTSILSWSIDRRKIHTQSKVKVNRLQPVPHHRIMSSTGSTKHNTRSASEKDNSQSLLNNDSTRHLKSGDRQRFFEDVYQHDVDNYSPSTHSQVDCRKPPMGSISSMEVNVDTSEQMDLMDISDQEALDVFLNSNSFGDEGASASPLPVIDCEDDDEDEVDEEAEVVYRERAPSQRQKEVYNGSQSRFSSTSSGSSVTSGGDVGTPVIQSDDEEVQADTSSLTSVPHRKDEETEEEDE